MKKMITVLGIGAMAMMIGIGSGFAQSQGTTPQPGVAAGTEQSSPAASTAVEKAKSTTTKSVEGTKTETAVTPKSTAAGASEKPASAVVEKAKTPEVKSPASVKPAAAGSVKPEASKAEEKVAPTKSHHPAKKHNAEHVKATGHKTNHEAGAVKKGVENKPESSNGVKPSVGEPKENVVKPEEPKQQ